MDKIKVTIYLTMEHKALLDAMFVSCLMQGTKKSYGDIIGEAIVALDKQPYIIK